MALDPSSVPSARRLTAAIASGDSLDVRRFSVHERMSGLFEISLAVLSDNPDIDFEANVGQPMRFEVQKGILPHENRVWTGVCKELQQVAVEDRGLSTYQLTLAPTLWLATQRRNHRMFQRKSDLDIALDLLSEWNIQPEKRLAGTYKKRKYRVQYGESDFTFLCRLLEDAGISFFFEAIDGETKLVLSDAPQANAPRPPIAFRDNPSTADKEHITNVRIGRRVRPGKYTVRDVDHRRPAAFKLMASAAGAGGVEEQLERFHYAPGAFLFESERGDPTPAADDKGKYRTDEGEGNRIAQNRLAAKRSSARVVAFDTNALDPAPGVVLSFLDHPKSEVAAGKTLLVIDSALEGTHDGEWSHACDAVGADVPYHPPLVTPKPKTNGVESATVVGPAGEEIHTDEMGRVRVHFHWDRESQMDDRSSCWIPVSQPWGGAGFGGTNLPRVGQEVIVDFLGGDPDRPVVIGRVYTSLQTTPYKLPDNKTQSGWKSNSTQGSGGYNEMMFEDALGKELLRMQAEKDLQKLVKHDEDVKIGNDRRKQVGHDDAQDVGHDRSRSVGNDEQVQVGNDERRKVGNDRSRSVGNNEEVSVGNNRSKQVGGNEEMQIAGNQSLTVGGNQSNEIGGNQKDKVDGHANRTIGKTMNLQVALTKAETVGIATAETVGIAKNLSIGKTYSITVGQSMNVQVGQSETETIGATKKVNVGEVYELACGASLIHVDSGGNVTITATNVAVKSSGPVLVEAGGPVKVEAGGTVKVKGSTVDIN